MSIALYSDVDLCHHQHICQATLLHLCPEPTTLFPLSSFMCTLYMHGVGTGLLSAMQIQTLLVWFSQSNMYNARIHYLGEFSLSFSVD
jgi:hypothetical protein